jgi:tRNA pseudouridine38-40 synthase
LNRFLLTVEYEGTNYSGWQRQLNHKSVQEELERAIETATRQFSTVMGASRTDAGVHALGQRAHFDTNATIPSEKWPYVLNTLLPRDIRVSSCLRVHDTLHARFSARNKEYEYRYFNRRHHSATRRNFAAFVPLPMDIDLMRQAVVPLVGTHDFAAFQAAGGTAKTTVRTIHSITIDRQGDEIILNIAGNAFLYNMVRIIAGTLIGISQGKLPVDTFQQALESHDRLVMGITAPACGLTLVKIHYEGLP